MRYCTYSHTYDNVAFIARTNRDAATSASFSGLNMCADVRISDDSYLHVVRESSIKLITIFNHRRNNEPTLLIAEKKGQEKESLNLT